MKDFLYDMGIDAKKLNFSDSMLMIFLILFTFLSFLIVILPLSLSIFGINIIEIINSILTNF
jgi:hypothetical protein